MLFVVCGGPFVICCLLVVCFVLCVVVRCSCLGARRSFFVCWLFVSVCCL